jgi:cytochrome c-type biogenesis protein CcmE
MAPAPAGSSVGSFASWAPVDPWEFALSLLFVLTLVVVLALLGLLGLLGLGLLGRVASLLGSVAAGFPALRRIGGRLLSTVRRDSPPAAAPVRVAHDDPESSDALIDPLAEARALLASTGGIRRRAWLGSRRRQVAAAVVILGAIGYLAFQGLTNATEYFLTTKQAVAQKASLGTKPFRIEGNVERDVTTVGGKLHFSIYSQGVAVAVVSTGSPTQLFKPGIPVVLEGHWQGNYYASNTIMVKHSASYTEAHPDRVKPQVPPSKSAS